MRLADPQWIAATTDGQIIGSYYHGENAEADARHHARQLGEAIAVRQWTPAGIVTRTTVYPDGSTSELAGWAPALHEYRRGMAAPVR